MLGNPEGVQWDCLPSKCHSDTLVNQMSDMVEDWWHTQLLSTRAPYSKQFVESTRAIARLRECRARLVQSLDDDGKERGRVGLSRGQLSSGSSASSLSALAARTDARGSAKEVAALGRMMLGLEDGGESGAVRCMYAVCMAHAAALVDREKNETVEDTGTGKFSKALSSLGKWEGGVKDRAVAEGMGGVMRMMRAREQPEDAFLASCKLVEAGSLVQFWAENFKVVMSGDGEERTGRGGQREDGMSVLSYLVNIGSSDGEMGGRRARTTPIRDNEVDKSSEGLAASDGVLLPERGEDFSEPFRTEATAGGGSTGRERRERSERKNPGWTTAAARSRQVRGRSGMQLMGGVRGQREAEGGVIDEKGKGDEKSGEGEKGGEDIRSPEEGDPNKDTDEKEKVDSADTSDATGNTPSVQQQKQQRSFVRSTLPHLQSSEECTTAAATTSEAEKERDGERGRGAEGLLSETPTGRVASRVLGIFAKIRLTAWNRNATAVEELDRDRDEEIDDLQRSEKVLHVQLDASALASDVALRVSVWSLASGEFLTAPLPVWQPTSSTSFLSSHPFSVLWEIKLDLD